MFFSWHTISNQIGTYNPYIIISVKILLKVIRSSYQLALKIELFANDENEYGKISQKRYNHIKEVLFVSKNENFLDMYMHK